VRHPSFKRFRPDREAEEIERERAVGEGAVGDEAAERPTGTMERGGPTVQRVPSKGKVEVEIGGRKLQLSNLDKVLYPEAGFTKAQVIDYYVRMAPVMVPHIKNRPMTLKRHPNGVQQAHFYEKQAPSHRPSWVKTTPITSFSDKRTIDFVLVNDVATLAWTANLATLELHPLLSLAGDVFTPTYLVFDLDPGAPADLVDCADVALLLRDLLATLKLECFPKTSGSRGMHLYLPLNTPVTYERTKPFALAVAQLLEKQHPKRITSNMSKAVRTGKVFIDWSQNDDHKSTVAVYSLRARERPTVAAPLSWDEVEELAMKRDAGAFVFEAGDLPERVERAGDLFEPVLTLKQELPSFGSEP
jgi:bifunctional non-homologous end joining protein LigD